MPVQQLAVIEDYEIFIFLNFIFNYFHLVSSSEF